jgi:6-phosphogluconolactonase
MAPYGRLLIKDSSDQLVTAAAEFFLSAASSAVKDKGSFRIAISGGATPRPVYQLLAKEPFRSGIPWDRVFVFWVDERSVLPDHQASNYGSAKNDLLEHVPIPKDQIYPIPADIPPEESADAYQEILMDFFKIRRGELPVFDLISLGMGSDGHIASLFPGHKSLLVADRLVVNTKGSNSDMDRITLTLPVINATKQIVFIVSGSSKAPIIKKVFEERQMDLPVHKVLSVEEKLVWLLDRESASLLSNKAQYDEIQRQ